MSKYSGKCDVYDMCGDYLDEKIRNTRFYVDENIIPLRIDNQKDLMPYYPFLVGMAFMDKDGGVVRMSKRSFVDTEEEMFLEFDMTELKKMKRKAKRKHEKFNPEEAAKQLNFNNREPADYQIEMANRVAKDGDKATFKGLHRPMSEYYRNQLLEDMVEAGYPRNKAKYWIWHDFDLLFERENDE